MGVRFARPLRPSEGSPGQLSGIRAGRRAPKGRPGSHRQRAAGPGPAGWGPSWPTFPMKVGHLRVTSGGQVRAETPTAAGFHLAGGPEQVHVEDRSTLRTSHPTYGRSCLGFADGTPRRGRPREISLPAGPPAARTAVPLGWRQSAGRESTATRTPGQKPLFF